MNAVEALLMSFDQAWKDDFESFEDACAGITEEESVWQPPAFAREPHDKGVGRPGTINWHLNHLELCHRHYAESIRSPDPDNPPRNDPPGELSLKPALKALDATTADLRNAIAALKPDDLSTIIRPGRDIANFIAMLTRHLTWHAAQIKTTRRLHAMRSHPGKVTE